MLKRLCLLAAAAIIVSCGGGGSSPLPPSKHSTTIFEQVGIPPVIYDPGNESYLPRDIGFIVTFDSGHATTNYDAQGVGATIDTWMSPPGSNQIKTINYAWMPSSKIYPWRDNLETRVCTSFKASVPSSYLNKSLLNYTGADIWLQDSVSGRVIIISGFFFVDNGHGTGASIDGGPYNYLASLNAVQFSGPFGSSRIFWTTAGTLQSTAWRAEQAFGYCLTQSQVQAMITLATPMLGSKINIANLTIKQALISSEVNIGVPSSLDPAAPGSRITTYFNSWRVTLE